MYMHTLRVRIYAHHGKPGGTPFMEGLLLDGNAMSAVVGMINHSGLYRETRITELHPRVVRVFHTNYINLGLENQQGSHQPNGRETGYTYSFRPCPKEDYEPGLRPFALTIAALVNTYSDISTDEKVRQQTTRLVQDRSARTF